ncbi:MAG: UDP-N-acetylmuramoyl-L-alanyl-D-glutamate--2,6-diaminopimelate ligase [Gemmatimonadetes bacterium SCN 70-22]|nr:MAG: UDP-N-acetylmuramoyl-L-alanyl-D-glutamate--2,6-diaminopimelate ligase [Gemmatimonadetes bacterium SCN 70-22]
MTSLASLAAIVDALRDAGVLVETLGTLPLTARSVTDDSRHVAPGALFIAVRGSVHDGHDFLAAAEGGGAAAAIVEDPGRTTLPRIVVRDGRRAAAVAAAAAHGFPGRSLSFVGVTGTSGKTTTVSMLRHLLDAPGTPAASIGTLGVLVGSEGAPLPGGAGLTTPGPVELQRLLRLLVDAGIRRVAMEVSSHALDQRRVEGVRFDAAVFTNLSRDHLDYHPSMEAYLAAKARLVSHIAPGGIAVVNDDVDTWRSLPPAPRVVRYGVSSARADVRAAGVTYTPAGSAWRLVTPAGEAPVTLPLIGDFNVANALGAAAAAWALGLSPAGVAARLSSLPQVPGRLEKILDRPTVLRDYAHKPDAMERALAAVRPFTTGRLIVVFGCGGDRDRGKRPIMGAIAERLADVVIVTSDNPRTEDPERILDEIEAGMQRPHERLEDRRAAIARALAIAAPGDVVVLAGKGHETYQIRGTTSHPFDEKRIVHELATSVADGTP